MRASPPVTLTHQPSAWTFPQYIYNPADRNDKLSTVHVCKFLDIRMLVITSIIHRAEKVQVHIRVLLLSMPDLRDGTVGNLRINMNVQTDCQIGPVLSNDMANIVHVEDVALGRTTLYGGHST